MRNEPKYFPLPRGGRGEGGLTTCDIFCAVVDNYGDIGVSWRLARQLAHEHGIAVRLWVDDLNSFRKLCPEIDADLARQVCQDVDIRYWTDNAFNLPQHPPPQPLSRLRERVADRPGEGVARDDMQPAEWVIEAFACELPHSYIEAMAAQAHQPVWINLEHLSAEEWVAGCHGLPSPHPSLPLIKYFFFPGFTPDTGGLLLEGDLIARRDNFQNNSKTLENYWQSFGLLPSTPDEVRVSLFSYENSALPALFTAWSEGNVPVTCLVPEGRALPQVAEFFGLAQAVPGEVYKRNNLEVRVLPFMEQDRYDELLWACDLNFVRGEDSCVRAQWAVRPFVWHIYPQHDHVHLKKLRAFMELYCSGLPPDAAHALRALWEWWNVGEGHEQAASTSSGQAWNDFWAHRSTLRQHAQAWAQQLSGNSLALNLLDFFHKVDRMRGSII